GAWLVRRAWRDAIARQIRFAVARSADAGQLQGEERGAEAAARSGAAPGVADRPRHVRARASRAEPRSRPAGKSRERAYQEADRARRAPSSRPSQPDKPPGGPRERREGPRTPNLMGYREV